LDVQPTVGRLGQAELYVKANGMSVRAASIPPGVSGQTINLNLSVQIFPKISLLHQGKPDPVNPGAWIPYQLSDGADVVIRICTSTGQLVRTLDLGHKPAGFYTDRDKAAHWDGRNEAGEHMADGVYIYSIEAGEFRATCKMIVTRGGSIKAE